MELQFIQSKIYEIRGQKVMLDRDLAELYGIETKRLKEAVRRNLRRFPVDFMFELNRKEFEFLRSQIASSNGRGGLRYMPFAFTEQGVCNLIVLWLFGLKTEFQWTDEPILMALNRNRKCRRFLSLAKNLPLIRGF